MTRPYLAIATTMLCAACGTSAATPSTTVAITTATESSESTEPNPAPTASYPLPRERLVRQTVPVLHTREIHPLENGAVVLIGEGHYAMVDDQMRIVRHATLPLFDEDRFSQVDETGRYVVFVNGLFDSVTGTMRENPEGRVYAECEPGLRRCVTMERTEAWLHVRFEDALTGTEIEAFDITHASVFGPDAATSALELTVAPAASIGGRYVSLTALYDRQFIHITYDLERHVVLAHRLSGPRERFEWVGTEGTSALLIRYGGVSLVDPRAPTFPTRVAVDGSIVREGSNDDVLVMRTDEGVRTYRRQTLVQIGEVQTSASSPVRGEGGSALVADTYVSFFGEDGRDMGRATFERSFSVWRPYALSQAGFFHFTESGFVRLRPGETNVHAAQLGRERETMQLGVNGGAFELAQGGTRFSLGAQGLTASAVSPSLRESAENDADEVESEERPTAVASPERRGVSRAFVQDGKVIVWDENEHEVARPVRLPRAVARSGCYQLAFISDADLALHGGAPCIPTRIHFREGRTSPLGRAYVSIASTPDGARVALMADRKMQVVDGRTGATLLRFDPAIPSPRSIMISDDGQQAALRSEAAIVIVNLAGLGATPRAQPELARFDQRHFVYSRHNNRLVTCERGVLKVVTPFGGTPDLEVPLRECGSFSTREGVSIDGFVAMRVGRAKIVVVRLRDAAILEIESVATDAAAALVLVRGDEVLGVAPSDTPLLLVRSEVGEDLLPLPAASPTTNEIVGAFFAAAS